MNVASFYPNRADGRSERLEPLWGSREGDSRLLALVSYLGGSDPAYAVFRRAGYDSASWVQITPDMNHKQVEEWCRHVRAQRGVRDAELRDWMDRVLKSLRVG